MSFINGVTDGFRNWLNTRFEKDATSSRQELLQAVLVGAANLGLPQRDIQNAQEMLDYDEYPLGFDIIVVQLYEFEIEITEQYFLLLEQTANRLQIPEVEYSFVKELIRSPKRIPKPVRKKISLLLQMLQEQ